MYGLKLEFFFFKGGQRRHTPGDAFERIVTVFPARKIRISHALVNAENPFSI
jgi:hypothetical protein